MSTATLHTPLPSLGLEATGLCGTCHHASSCAHFARATSAVHHCELFESEPPPTLAFREVRLVEAQPEPVVDPLEDPPTAGLCVNCDNRTTCMLPQAVGGVWHCEEYR